MSKVVLKNTQTKAVVKVVVKIPLTSHTQIYHIPLRLNLETARLVATTSRGAADSVQVPTRLEVCRVIYSLMLVLQIT